MRINKIYLNSESGLALVLCLIMITIITICVGLVLMGHFYHIKSIQKQIHKNQAYYYLEGATYEKMNSMTNYTLSSDEQLKVDENVIVNLKTEPYGGYIKLTSGINYKGINASLLTLIGQKPSKAFENAIYLGGVGYPLVVIGENKIIGDVYVGDKGVEAGNIQGEEFKGVELVFGKIKTVQEPQMPYFDTALFKHSFQEFENILSDTTTYEKYTQYKGYYFDHNSKSLLLFKRTYISDFEPDSLLKLVRYVISWNDIIFDGNYICDRHIKFITRGRIKIENDAQIRNSILYSDQSIEISDNARVASQIFSKKDITINGKSTIEYPSVIYSQGTNRDNMIQGNISIQDNVVIMGTIIIQPEIDDEKNIVDLTLINIGKDVKVIGSIYSNHYITNEGCVWGSIVTKYFYQYREPTNYLNLLNSTITNRNKLPSLYRMPLLFGQDPILDVVSWQKIYEIEF